MSIIENPLEGYSIKNFRHKSKYYSAFIAKRNNNIELFDLNEDKINIWDIEDNNQPKNVIKLNNALPFDICLWNNEFLLVSTNIGFQLINCENDQDKIIIDECKDKNFSKIRKIVHKEEFQGIVGIDQYNRLNFWRIINK